MNKYSSDYSGYIPVEIAEKLGNKGMKVFIDSDTFDAGTEYQKDERWCENTYGEVFDWFASEKNIAIIAFRATQHFRISLRNAKNGVLLADVWNTPANGADASWREAADTAIEKALELI